jgi:hypothetical protein
MLAVQLLDFQSVRRVHKTHPCTAPAAARTRYRVKSSWSAALPVRSKLNTVVPESRDTVRAAPNFEHVLRLLTTIEAQGVFAADQQCVQVTSWKPPQPNSLVAATAFLPGQAPLEPRRGHCNATSA